MIQYILPAVPGLMAAGALAAAARVIVRRRRLNEAWYRGVTVEGRCLRTFVTTATWRRGLHQHTNSTVSHAYEFTTPDGRTLRFEEDGPSTVFDGDVVPVRYPQGRPDLATALPPGDRGTRGKFRLQLGFLAFATLLCLAATAVFSLTTQIMTDVFERTRDMKPPASPSSPTSPESPAPPAAPAPPSMPSLPPLPSGPPDDFPTGFPTDLPGAPTGFPTDFPKPPTR
ncbi:hypothetical protein [Streptomyces griseocarneus]|uniref:hypothetical protein n=1 Tax=Streptomyces griseocarneus TaxID=51201 RepID=UPI00167E98A2|nr:hypothetical protein [Streptomyces griseocarneus]